MDLALIILVASVILLTFAYWRLRQKNSKGSVESKEEL